MASGALKYNGPIELPGDPSTALEAVTKRYVDQVVGDVDAADVGLGNVSDDKQLKAASNLADVPERGQARSNLDVYATGKVDSLLSAKADKSVFATVATSGKYNDLSNKPDLSLYAPALERTYMLAHLSANQSISANTFTKVAFDQTDEDTLGEFNVASNRFIAASAGTYMIALYLDISIGSSGANVATLSKNGLEYNRVSSTPIPSGGNAQIGGSVCLRLAAGDIIEGFVYSTGTAVYKTEKINYFEITRLW